MFILFIFTQYFLLNLAIDSKKTKSSSADIFSWATFFLVVHIFFGVVIYSDEMPGNNFQIRKFAFHVILPVFLGSILKLIRMWIQAKKAILFKGTSVTTQANNNFVYLYKLERVVQSLVMYFKQIKQQKNQIGANLEQNIQLTLTSIEAKLIHLQERIDQEKTKNKAELDSLRLIPSEKNIVIGNLNVLQSLQIEKNSFLRSFQIEKPHLLAKSVRQQASDSFHDSFQQTQKVIKRPSKPVSDVPISRRLSKIEEDIKTLQDDLIAFKQAGKHSEEINQFVDATPEAIDQLNETIEDCIHDVKVTCHPTTAKARTRQLNELGEQLRQFTFDFKGFAKNLNFTKVLDTTQAILPHQQVHSIPELETQAQELWQEYHPESEEVFWELYNELLAKVKK